MQTLRHCFYAGEVRLHFVQISATKFSVKLLLGSLSKAGCVVHRFFGRKALLCKVSLKDRDDGLDDVPTLLTYFCGVLEEYRDNFCFQGSLKEPSRPLELEKFSLTFVNF